MNTSFGFGFLYNQRNLFLKIIQIESEHLKTVSTFNYLQFPKITWSGFTTFLLLLLHAFTDLCIVVLLIFAFCIFVFFSETQLGFVPVPSLFLSLCCVQTFCVFLLKATCQPALSLAGLVFIYVCICIFLEKKPVNLLSHQQNLYLYFYSYFSWKQPVNLLSHLQKLLCLE